MLCQLTSTFWGKYVATIVTSPARDISGRGLRSRAHGHLGEQHETEKVTLDHGHRCRYGCLRPRSIDRATAGSSAGFPAGGLLLVAKSTAVSESLAGCANAH